MIGFSVSASFPNSADEVCDQIFDVSTWQSFAGYGPIPGIAEAILVSLDDQRLGTRFEVTNVDGSKHVETVIEYVPQQKLRLRMDSFTSPLGKLADHFVESWEFREDGGETRVERSFELYPRNFAGRIILTMISWILRTAVQKHLESMVGAVAGSTG